MNINADIEYIIPPAPKVDRMSMKQPPAAVTPTVGSQAFAVSNAQADIDLCVSVVINMVDNGNDNNVAISYWGREVEPALARCAPQKVGISIDLWWIILNTKVLGAYLERTYGYNTNIKNGIRKCSNVSDLPVVRYRSPTSVPVVDILDVSEPIGWKTVSLNVFMEHYAAPKQTLTRFGKDVTHLADPEKLLKYKRLTDQSYTLPKITMWDRLLRSKHIDTAYYKSQE